MMTGTLETIDDRRALRFERFLPHASERVWRAVTEPEELSAWFVATPPWTPSPGEIFEAHGQPGRITTLEAPRVIAWEWGPERYSFELHPEGDGCKLVFLHFFDESMGPGGQRAAGWESYLNRLDALLAGGELSEAEAHRVVPELNERYAIAFGEDPSGPGSPSRGTDRCRWASTRVRCFASSGASGTRSNESGERSASPPSAPCGSRRTPSSR